MNKGMEEATMTQTSMPRLANHGFPELCPAKPGYFRLRFQNDEGTWAEIELDTEELRRLGQQCFARMKPLQHSAPRTDAAAEAPHRQKGHYFETLDDLALRMLVQAAEVETLAQVLWYLNNSALQLRVLSHCAQRVAEELKQAIEKLAREGDPDSALRFEAENARWALDKMLQLAERVAEQRRQIETETRGGQTS